MALDRKEDLSWVRGMFGLIPRNLADRHISTKQPTIADFKFGDTTLGGNPAINAPYQFTRFADIKSSGLLADKDLRPEDQGYEKNTFTESSYNHGSYCMGRVYSEVIDDNAQYLHLRFGVPKYTGTITFFSNMYDIHAAKLAKQGEYSSWLRTAGKAIGLTAMFVVIPMHVFFPLIITSQVLKVVLDKKPSKYYYLKPTPNLYWQAVQAILDTQLLHHRLVPMWDVIGGNRYIDINDPNNKLHESFYNGVYKDLPDIWKANGKFDVLRMANRYHILANYQQSTLNQIYEQSGDKDFNAKILSYLQEVKRTKYMQDSVNEKQLNLEMLARRYEANPFYQGDDEAVGISSEAWTELEARFKSEHGVSGEQITQEQSQYQQATAGKEKAAEKKDPKEMTFKDFWGSFFSDALEQGQSELYDASQFVSFKVDAKDSISDSLTNGTREPEISQSLNGISSKARTLDFSMSGGRTGFDIIDSVVSGTKELLAGALEGVSLTGIASFFGGAVVDIPDVWDSSEANIGTVSYTIPLRTPYGNDMSIFQDIIVPLSMILAAAMPIATGRQTHTSPFICEAYSRGRQVTRLGIIDSVSITRGVGNMGWRADGRMLGCDVTISIKDLSRVLTMPLYKDPGIFDDDNKYTDYMATLGAAGLQEMIYGTAKFAMNLNKWKQSWKSWAMTGRITNSVMETFLGRAASAFTTGTLLR